MSSPTLSCRCRFCGYTLSYPKADIGTDARCPQCGQTIRLPGKLAPVATVISRRRKDPLGIALEIAGFASMFFFFPWGMMAGAILVYAGWRKSNVLLCSNCSARLPRTPLEKCPSCKTRFAAE